MRKGKLILVSAGVSLYWILLIALLSTVYWRSACAKCDAVSCLLHKAAAGLLLVSFVSGFVIPSLSCFWIKCIKRKPTWAYSVLGFFLLFNTAIITSGCTVVIIVEQFLCPTDKAVAFAAVVLIFVTWLFSCILIGELYYEQNEIVYARAKKNDYAKMEALAKEIVESDLEEL